MRTFCRSIVLRLVPPYRRVSEALAAANVSLAEIKREQSRALSVPDQADPKLHKTLRSGDPGESRGPAIKIVRGAQTWQIEPDLFEVFKFRDGDLLSVVPPEAASRLPTTWGDVNIEIEPGRAIRVPPRFDFFEYNGFQIPTHLLEAEVLHYMREIARVLKSQGKVYASFFLHSSGALAAARTSTTTPWRATFEHTLSEGVYANDPTYPRGAVAFTDATMRKLIHAAGLKLERPYLKGSWSGLHTDPDDGQDAAILSRA